MKTTLLVLFFIIFTSIGFTQNIQIEKPDLSGINTLQSPLWGDDVVISNFEPIGPISSIQAANGTIYVAINDTLATSNLGLIIMQSTNNGNSWSLYSTGLNLRVKFEKIKLISAGGTADSIYLFVQNGSTVYSWNFRNLTLNTVGWGGIMSTFDVVGASTGALYCFFDTIPTAVRRMASIDGGATWINRGSVSTTGAKPKVSISSGDTISLSYYYLATMVGNDTTTSAIRISRYRQLTNGTIGVISLGSTPSELATETTPKQEHISALENGTLWFLYTIGTTGNINIKGRCSRDGGRTYSDTLLIAANPNVDEYWIDVRYNRSTAGFDFIYYADSLQSGPPSNNTDKIVYRYANYIDSTNFGVLNHVSQHAPLWSSANYIPSVLPLTNDAGVIWVGIDGATKKLYWNRYALITKIVINETPVSYSLSQNYPNPFNPTTKINFNVAKNGLVTMKVYNILGKEVATLVNGNYNAGSYSVDFNASKLSSGVYFYSIEVNGFKDIKKMMLVK